MNNKGLGMRKVKKVTSTKKTPKTLKAKKQKEVIPSQEEIMARLKKWFPKVVGQTVARYKNSSLSSVFNEADMIALAEDTALDVTQRIILGDKYPRKNQEKFTKIDMRGCESYFKTAFKNQTLKLYESYGQTDIRAGIQIVSSEEAMAVATSKNLYNPEDSYIVNDIMSQIKSILDASDAEHNVSVMTYYNKINEKPKPTDLQYYSKIVQQILDGNTAVQICESLQIDTAEFLRQKRLAFELVKTQMPNSLEDLLEHFECAEDYRVHTKEVAKRQKFEQEVKNYKTKVAYYVGSQIKSTVVKGKNGKNKEVSTFEATLYARIDLYNKFDTKTNKVPSKLISVKTLTCDAEDENCMKSTKDSLMKDSKSLEIHQQMEAQAQIYLEEVKNKKVA